jgi:F0F1-type ATP synthase delta subunit
MKLFFENTINTGNKDNVRDFLQKITTVTTTIPTVELTLAFEPTEEILMNLSQWFMMQLKKQVLFAIKIDYSLIAGACISFSGKYKDYSLKPFFDNVASTGTAPASAQTSAPVPPNDQPEAIHQSTEFIEIGR